MSTLRAIAAAAMLSVAVLPSTGVAADFPAVVTEILQGQTDGPISKMNASKKSAVIDCVNKVLVGMPNGMKRYVLQGTDYQDRERRFGKVLLDNRAEWKQNIARACASIALSGGV